MAEKWDLRKDTHFDTYVSSTEWNEFDGKWIVRTEPGTVYKTKFFSLCTGISAKRYIPDWKGIETFQGNFIALSRHLSIDVVQDDSYTLHAGQTRD